MSNQLDEANDLLMGGGVRAFQFNQLGDTCRGRITADPKVEDCFKMKWDAVKKRWERTDELDTWPNGQVKRQIVLTVQTDERVDQDDDGLRTLFIHSRIQPALRDAIKAAGAKGLAVGGTIAVQWASGAGTQDGGPKEYRCGYQSPTVDPGSLLGDNAQAAPATQPAPAAAAAPSAAASLGITQPAAVAIPCPAGMDPEKWALLPEMQQRAIAAAMAQPANQPIPF